MTPIEMFVISFFGSFAGTLVAFIAQYYLYKKQTEQLEKLKRSLQNTVRKLKIQKRKTRKAKNRLIKEKRLKKK